MFYCSGYRLLPFTSLFSHWSIVTLSVDSFSVILLYTRNGRDVLSTSSPAYLCDHRSGETADSIEVVLKLFCRQQFVIVNVPRKWPNNNQYIKDYKVGICRGGGSTVNSERVDGQQWGDRQLTLLTVDPGGRVRINSQQWEGQQSTVRQLTINGQQWEGWWSTVRWSMINGQQWAGWQSTVRWSMINTVDCWSLGGGGRINSQQWEGQQSTVRWLMINSQQ